jgi:hypothetical protein
MLERATIDQRFAIFHAQNPHVYSALRDLARQGIASGMQKLGIKQLFEVLRWQSRITTSGGGQFKLPNDYHSRYSRLLMESETDLAGVFNTRRLQSEDGE